MPRAPQKTKPAVPALLRRLRHHFDTDPAHLTVIEQQFATYERPNLQLALRELLSEPGRVSELVGVVTTDYVQLSLARLARPQSAQHFDEGPVGYVDAALPGDQRLACVKTGLFLIRDAAGPMALLLHEGERWQPDLRIELMAHDPQRGEIFLRTISRIARDGKAYRGHVLSVEEDCNGNIQVNSHKLPSITRDSLILPEPLMKRIERHTLSFARHAETLRSAGRHMKRGILLHGPPGTGKTLTAMYLVSQMPGRTVMLLTGGGVKSIEAVCRLGRMLTPVTVVMEDVDLIGTVREHQSVGANALLFELLNQMDGLGEDCDILFLLTTNRPDILEPALASRPGRIDQAIEVPPPDAECRRRLLELYGRGLQVELAEPERVIDRTAGVSAAFIRELLRKAAVFAAEEGGELMVRDRHIDEALGELLIAGGKLTQTLLGAAPLTTNGAC